MAIQSKFIPQNEWTELTDKSCTFQNRSNGDILMATGTAEPTNTNDAFAVQPKQNASYASEDDKLYIYRTFDGTCLVAYQE
jgi:hypothetical protein